MVNETQHLNASLQKLGYLNMVCIGGISNLRRT
jgi:hypothetical protein